VLRRLLLAVPVALAATAGSARADIIAAVEVQRSGGADLDIRLLNAGTGSVISLPAGVNTSADELHPSLTKDGTRMVFQRIDGAGTNRIVAVTMSGGQSADLFTGFEVAETPPSTPAIKPDGAEVATGRPTHAPGGTPGNDPGETQTAALTLTGLGGFPGGPFTHTTRDVKVYDGTSGETLHPAYGGTRMAVGAVISGQLDEILVVPASGSPVVITSSNAHLRHPAMDADAGSLVLMESRTAATGVLPNIAFRSPTGTGAPTALPALVNSSSAETRPALTADGRFVGFVRTTSAGDRLFVWDSQTQTLLNPSGVSLGSVPSRARSTGNLTLRVKPTIVGTAITPGSQLATVDFQLTQPAGVGILVQKIVGRTQVLGRSAPKLKPIGRVPFGKFKKGKGKARWDYRVEGKRLRPGRYLVTPRSLSGDVVSDFGESERVRVPKPRKRG
jgi:WD40 repeat protein